MYIYIYTVHKSNKQLHSRRKRVLLGHQFLAAGQFAEAEARLRGALDGLRGVQGGDLPWEQKATRYLAAACAQQSGAPGDAKALEAEALFRAAARAAEGLADAPADVLPGTLADLCHFLTNQGDLEEAERLCKRSLSLARERGSSDAACAAQQYLGMLHERRGDLARAERFLRQAASIITAQWYNDTYVPYTSKNKAY